MKTLFSMLLLIFGIGLVIGQEEAATETAASVYNDGLEALKAKKYAEACDLMAKASDLADPESDAQVLELANKNLVIALYYAGTAELKEKKYDEAMARFEKGLEMDPKSYTHAYGKAKVLDSKGMQMEAIDAYFQAAAVANEAGKADRAERYIKRTASMIGKLYVNKEYDQAVNAGEAYLASGNDSESVRYYMAKSLLKQGKASDALTHAEKANEMAGEGAEDYKYTYTVAEIQEALGNKAAAAATYSKVKSGKYFESASYKAKNLN